MSKHSYKEIEQAEAEIVLSAKRKGGLAFALMWPLVFYLLFENTDCNISGMIFISGLFSLLLYFCFTAVATKPSVTDCEHFIHQKEFKNKKQ